MEVEVNRYPLTYILMLLMSYNRAVIRSASAFPVELEEQITSLSVRVQGKSAAVLSPHKAMAAAANFYWGTAHNFVNFGKASHGAAFA